MTDTNEGQLTAREQAKAIHKANSAKKSEEIRAKIRARQYEEDKDLVIEAMRRILGDDNTTPAQVVFATETLDYLVGGVGFVPYRAHLAIDREAVDLGAFKKAVDVLTNMES